MLYIHIPFCQSRCTYCSFYSTTLFGLRGAYVEAVCREIAARGAGPHTTIYIGGGTPSTLSARDLGRIVEAATAKGSPEELTIECNPDDMTPAFARDLVRIGFNRVSMGAQTFSPTLLEAIGRRHTAGQTIAAVECLRQAGIGNISLDLMYGFAGQTVGQVEADVESLLALRPEHISTYCLSVEEGTPMWKAGVKPADDEIACDMYFAIRNRLMEAGYEHYELSNYALPHRRSRHNSGYWDGTPYVGVGAAAHSYDGQRLRSWNVADVRAYIAGAEPEWERLTDDELYEEKVMLALRTYEGLDLTELTQERAEYALNASAGLIAEGMLERKGTRLRLTPKALFIADSVIRELM